VQLGVLCKYRRASSIQIQFRPLCQQNIAWVEYDTVPTSSTVVEEADRSEAISSSPHHIFHCLMDATESMALRATMAASTGTYPQ